MRPRVLVGLSLLVGCACASAACELWSAIELDPETRHARAVAYYDGERFAGLAPSLPAGGVVGYVEDHPEGEEMGRPYYLTQYALAPCVLPEDADRPLVLVNGRPETVPDLGDRRLLLDLGHGVRLFGRGGP